MAQSRYYSSTARKTALAQQVDASSTTIVVNQAQGFPATYPFTIILDRDTIDEEIVECTAVAGSTLTVTRGADGTTPVAHAVGAQVEHGVSARDFRESRQHEAASQNVHGLALNSSVVGTTESQTLTNKTLTDPTINGGSINADSVQVSGDDAVTETAAQTLTNKTLSAPTINNGILTGTSLSAPTIGDFSNAEHDHSTAAKGGNIPQSSVTGLPAALDSKESVANVDAHIADTTAHGATGAVVGTTNAQTLTNKTLTSPTVTDPTVSGSVTATGATVSGGTLSGQTVTGASLGSDLDADGNKVTNVATPTVSSDAATKGYVDAEVSAVVDAAPGALDTLNELAAALGDDANFSTSVTNSIAEKVAKSGDTMTGDLAMSGGAKVTGLPTPSAASDAAPKSYIDQVFGDTASAAQSDASAAQSAIEAAQSAGEASDSAAAALASEQAAAQSAANSAASETAAGTSAGQASTSAGEAATSASQAAASQSAASASEIAAAASESAAAASESAAAASESNAAASEALAQDWAIKTDGPVDNGEFSAKYWAGVANTSNSVSANTVDAKGDLIAGAADNTVVRVPVGTDDQVLMADSTTGSGLKWGTVDVSGEIAAHNSATTSVHGIADTSLLETQSGAQAKADAAQSAAASALSAHESATTSVHGIADTAALETQSGAQSKANAAESAANSYTDNAIASFEALPSQTNNGGKFLSTDGSNTSWQVISPGATGGGTDRVFHENDVAVTADYTITAGKNAGTFGPVTVNSGVTVTISSGSDWTVV